MASYTPMIMQYLAIKEEAKDAFLFFRLGDFYEMFFEDAIAASRELEITLTGREGGGTEKIPMCGVPYHSAQNYIARLVEKGYKVAICEQVEDPAAAKGVVRREIVQVITPGTVMESKALSDKTNNFISAVALLNGKVSISSCDLSTGELYVTSFPLQMEALIDEINVYQPAEIVGDEELLGKLQASNALNRPILLTKRELVPEQKLLDQFGKQELVQLNEACLRAVNLLIGYLDDTQKRSLGHVRAIRSYEPGQYMILDHYTRRNLELTETVRDRSKKGSLLWLLDRSQTSMGARLMRRWIDKPLLSRTAIEARLEAVDTLYRNLILRDDIRSELHDIYDLERLVGRVAFGSANGRDMNALKTSIQRVPQLVQLCRDSGSQRLEQLVDGLDDCTDLADMIATVVVDEPPVSIREGGLIRAGYDDYLDQLKEASTNGKKWLAELERAEREATGIRSLKIGYNKIFGYYLEVSKANLAMLPEGRYERKQTLSNAERFVTPELKEKERLILEAEEKMVDLEYERFLELREHLAGQLHRLQLLAEVIAELDVYQAFATVSAERRFTRPSITDSFDMVIEEGRHPVVEAVMENGAAFIANATQLHKESNTMLLITGPNMAGKSTYMRQVALIGIMAQIGCFVPAKSAQIPLTDRIFTRIGAADDLIGGQSTFMVEMKDIQIMTEKATESSLVIIDELGRGTSTGEGMAIAQAVIEYVHHQIRCKALVSTHFHELSHLEDSLPLLTNACMAVQESGDHVTFLRKLIPGAAGTSYGIYCAKLAGLPESIISRSYELLEVSEAVVETNVSSKVSTGAVAGTESQTADQQAPYVESEKEQLYEAIQSGAALSNATEHAYNSNSSETDHSATQASNAGVRETAAAIQLSIWDEPAAAQADSGRRKGNAKSEQLADQLRKLDLYNMTPMQAMQWLGDMKRKMND
ncbi:DNA mismatch repair protein MutS [Paenibacillus sp. FSL H8-0537]|uniref:DNA mismatch repair protein MutS n=1 Tax=Paenibacillus sp. FSL H8-0537 TaxID=2921399 RepID=UPI00310118F7